MKFRIVVVLLVVSVAVNLGVVYKLISRDSERNQHRDASKHCSWTHNPVCWKLNLTEDQIEKLEENRKNFQRTILPVKEKLSQERHLLFSLLKNEPMDPGAIGVSQKKICEFQGEIQRHFIDHFSHIKKLFTTDQQRQFYFYFEQGLCADEVSKRKKK